MYKNFTMTEFEALLLVDFERKLNQLMELTDRFKEEKKELELTVTSLKNEVEVLRQENHELVKRNERLKLVQAITGAGGETQKARMNLNKMVREIDKCIALLNQ